MELLCVIARARPVPAIKHLGPVMGEGRYSRWLRIMSLSRHTWQEIDTSVPGLNMNNVSALGEGRSEARQGKARRGEARRGEARRGDVR